LAQWWKVLCGMRKEEPALQDVGMYSWLEYMQNRNDMVVLVGGMGD